MVELYKAVIKANNYEENNGKDKDKYPFINKIKVPKLRDIKGAKYIIDPIWDEAYMKNNINFSFSRGRAFCFDGEIIYYSVKKFEYDIQIQIACYWGVQDGN